MFLCLSLKFGRHPYHFFEFFITQIIYLCLGFFCDSFILNIFLSVFVLFDSVYFYGLGGMSASPDLEGVTCVAVTLLCILHMLGGSGRPAETDVDTLTGQLARSVVSMG